MPIFDRRRAETLDKKPDEKPTVRGVDENEPRPILSIWLYLAGLCVTLSGLYAVNFGIEDQNFVMLTYGVAIAGYILSYFLRLYRVSLQSIQVPLMVCLGLIFFAGVSSDQGLSWFAPTSVLEDRAKGLQLIFVYMALIHCFTLSSDAAVLFACVPCMTMLALVSTTTTEPQVQNAFLFFIGSATFLMVHENYLRTRNARLMGRTLGPDHRLFGGQLQLTAFCVVGALVLANFVAVPIRTVGQTLFVPGTFNTFNNSKANNSQSQRQNNPQISVSEGNAIDLGRGPEAESDVPILSVRADVGMNLRGATFDYYTGRRFENRLGNPVGLEPEESAQDQASREKEWSNISREGTRSVSSDRKRYRVPSTPYDLTAGEMENSIEREQTVTILGGSVSAVYGAGKVERVEGGMNSLSFTSSGLLTPPSPLPVTSQYKVVSRLANDEPDRLRAASSSLDDVPQQIRDAYLQTRGDGEPENERLRAKVAEIVTAAKTNYDRVETIRTFIASTCKYNLQAPAAPQGKDVVDNFIFETQQGYCDRFAAAMTLMCRYARIPARLASGFLYGDVDKDGNYIIKQKHKHVWTEVFFPKIGWVPFDATEGAVDISDHSAKDKKKAMSFIAWLLSNGWLPPTVGLIIVVLALYLLKTELVDRFQRRQALAERMLQRAPTNVAIILAYEKVCAAFKQRGLARPVSATPVEYAAWIAERTGTLLPGMQEPMTRLTALHARYRYGAEVASQEEVRLAEEAVTTITAALAQAKGAAFATPLQKSPA